MTVVFKVSDNVKQNMIKFYQDKADPKTPPYAIFQVKDFDCVTTLYESGKVVFQGIGADIEASIWIMQEKKLNNRDISVDDKKDKKDKDKKNKDDKQDIIKLSGSIIGSDECGTGDYFGPIVVCAAYTTKEDYSLLNELGVRDSKKITDEQIIKIAPTIIKNIKHKVIVLDNETYNKYYSSDVNMNKIKALLHNKALLSLLRSHELEYNYIVVDQFTTPKSYYGYLSSLTDKVTDITFITHAEDQVLSVGVASVIARYAFLKEIHKLSTTLGVKLPLGASDKVDQVALELVKKNNIEYLNKIAKTNFKNTDKVKDLLK